MINELYLAKDPDGKIYGFHTYPEWHHNDGDGYWLPPDDDVNIFYPDQLLFLFGDKIKSIEVTGNLPVKIMFNAEVVS